MASDNSNQRERMSRLRLRSGAKVSASTRHNAASPTNGPGGNHCKIKAKASHESNSDAGCHIGEINVKDAERLALLPYPMRGKELKERVRSWHERLSGCVVA